MSVADRDEPVMSCWEWHGDGMAGEHDRALNLIVKAPARAMGEAVPSHREPRWQAAEGGAADSTLAMAHPWDQADRENQPGDECASRQGQGVTRGESEHVPPGAGRSEMDFCGGWPRSIGGPGRYPGARPQERRCE